MDCIKPCESDSRALRVLSLLPTLYSLSNTFLTLYIIYFWIEKDCTIYNKRAESQDHWHQWGSLEALSWTLSNDFGVWFKSVVCNSQELHCLAKERNNHLMLSLRRRYIMEMRLNYYTIKLVLIYRLGFRVRCAAATLQTFLHFKLYPLKVFI